MNIQHDCSVELKQAHLAATPARIAALRLFESQENPLDAQYLIELLSKEGIDRVTIFRILNIFVEKGLLRKIDFKEGKARYELSSRGDHHHFVCEKCGKVFDIGRDTIMHDYIENMEKEYGFSVSDHSLEFFGFCKDCQRKEVN